MFISFIFFEVKHSQILGVTPFTRSLEEPTKKETVQRYLLEAESRLKEGPLTIATETFEETYENSNVETISIELTNDEERNCGAAIEGATNGGGCYHSGENTIVISPTLGNGEALRALIIHEYAHYLQYLEQNLPSNEPLSGDTYSEIECLADNMAIGLRIAKELLYYTESGGCASNSSLENSNPYYEPMDLETFVKSLL